MKTRKERQRRLLPLFLAALFASLVPLTTAQALFGRDRAVDPGAPIAQAQEIRAYCGVACTGTLRAIDSEGGSVTFSLLDAPKKGTLELSEDGAFVYTPLSGKAGADSFTFTAADEDGNVSQSATVKIRILKSTSGVQYADTDGSDAATAAMDLAERGIFVGARVGDRYFFEPERAVTRAEFAAMCLKAAGLRESEVNMTGFCDDESIPTWCKSVAASALRSGMVRGAVTADGVAFRPDRAITLGEAATVLNRLLEITDVDLSGYLGASVSAWNAQAVANLESVSLLPSGSFGSSGLDAALTRAEAARLLSSAAVLMDRRSAEAGLFARLFG